MEATCQCGRITFTTPLAKPTTIYICHCTECRHQSSSSYGLTAIFPTFTLPTEGVSAYTRPNSNGTTKGYFCTNCGSRLVHQHIAPDGRKGDLVSVKAGCLKALDREMMKEAVHIWTKSAIVDVPEGSEAYEEEPPGGSFFREE